MCCGGRRRRCARVSGILLAHVNLLLMLFSGAGLATSARLKWDPSAYIPIREALPVEYRVACALVFTFALVLLVLAHTALSALFARASSSVRRPALFTYAALMTALMVVELVAMSWVAWRVTEFLQSPAAERLLELAELREHLRAALQILARWYPLPEKFNDLVNEAIADAPRNAYAAAGVGAALLVLQPLGVALALAAAAPRRARYSPAAPATSTSSLDTTSSAGTFARPDQRGRFKYHSEAGNGLEKAPLRTAYKNGRLVIL